MRLTNERLGFKYSPPFSAELDDVMHELENQRHTCSNLEKKQRQFDKQLQEERLIATTRAEERDQSQARERAAEAKVWFYFEFLF